MVKTTALIICLMLALATQAKSQNPIGDFTRSPSEHIINEIDHPFVVRSVSGLITMHDGSPLTAVLLEIQGPGTDHRIRRCKTDEHGRFNIKNVPEGTYRFKATLNGYQSEMGTITVSKKAPHTNLIMIEMTVGV